MDNINVLIKEKGWTKQRLAKEINMSRENLYRILNGNPTLDNLKKIASALDVPVWKLFSDIENQLFGIVVFKGENYPINSRHDLENLLSLIDKE